MGSPLCHGVRFGRADWLQGRGKGDATPGALFFDWVEDQLGGGASAIIAPLSVPNGSVNENGLLLSGSGTNSADLTMFPMWREPGDDNVGSPHEDIQDIYMVWWAYFPSSFRDGTVQNRIFQTTDTGTGRDFEIRVEADDTIKFLNRAPTGSGDDQSTNTLSTGKFVTFRVKLSVGTGTDANKFDWMEDDDKWWHPDFQSYSAVEALSFTAANADDITKVRFMSHAQTTGSTAQYYIAGIGTRVVFGNSLETVSDEEAWADCVRAMNPLSFCHVGDVTKDTFVLRYAWDRTECDVATLTVDVATDSSGSDIIDSFTVARPDDDEVGLCNYAEDVTGAVPLNPGSTYYVRYTASRGDPFVNWTSGWIRVEMLRDAGDTNPDEYKVLLLGHQPNDGAEMSNIAHRLGMAHNPRYVITGGKFTRIDNNWDRAPAVDQQAILEAWKTRSRDLFSQDLFHGTAIFHNANDYDTLPTNASAIWDGDSNFVYHADGANDGDFNFDYSPTGDDGQAVTMNDAFDLGALLWKRWFVDGMPTASDAANGQYIRLVEDGRTAHVMLDVRFQRTASLMLGNTQMATFKGYLKSSPCDIIFVHCVEAFGNEDKATGESWDPTYVDDRDEILDFIRDEVPSSKNVIFVYPAKSFPHITNTLQAEDASYEGSAIGRAIGVPGCMARSNLANAADEFVNNADSGSETAKDNIDWAFLALDAGGNVNQFTDPITGNTNDFNEDSYYAGYCLLTINEVEGTVKVDMYDATDNALFDDNVFGEGSLTIEAVDPIPSFRARGDRTRDRSFRGTI